MHMARNSLQPLLEFVQQLSKSASNHAINLKTTVLKKVYKMNGSTQPSCLCIEERGYIKNGEKINTVPAWQLMISESDITTSRD